ncbi:hypothetical protein HK101_007452 [Irineochytrium annulatum]|nr:hypothetical protein HK101_007452 [Irineochytrium annulatum]
MPRNGFEHRRSGSVPAQPTFIVAATELDESYTEYAAIQLKQKKEELRLKYLSFASSNDDLDSRRGVAAKDSDYEAPAGADSFANPPRVESLGFISPIRRRAPALVPSLPPQRSGSDVNIIVEPAAYAAGRQQLEVTADWVARTVEELDSLLAGKQKTGPSANHDVPASLAAAVVGAKLDDGPELTPIMKAALAAKAIRDRNQKKAASLPRNFGTRIGSLSNPITNQPASGSSIFTHTTQDIPPVPPMPPMRSPPATPTSPSSAIIKLRRRNGSFGQPAWEGTAVTLEAVPRISNFPRTAQTIRPPPRTPSPPSPFVYPTPEGTQAYVRRPIPESLVHRLARTAAPDQSIRNPARLSKPLPPVPPDNDLGVVTRTADPLRRSISNPDLLSSPNSPRQTLSTVSSLSSFRSLNTFGSSSSLTLSADEDAMPPVPAIPGTGRRGRGVAPRELQLGGDPLTVDTTEASGSLGRSGPPRPLKSALRRPRAPTDEELRVVEEIESRLEDIRTETLGRSYVKNREQRRSLSLDGKRRKSGGGGSAPAVMSITCGLKGWQGCGLTVERVSLITPWGLSMEEMLSRLVGRVELLGGKAVKLGVVRRRDDEDFVFVGDDEDWSVCLDDSMASGRVDLEVEVSLD